MKQFPSRKRFFISVGISGLFLAGCILAAPLIGSTTVDYSRIFTLHPDFSSPDMTIMFQVRFPRTLLAAVTGAMLSVAGVAFQALLGNPLATPYTLGVSSSAAFGAVIAIVTGARGFFGLPVTEGFAMLGALAGITIVHRLARRDDGTPTHVLLLGGVTISFFFSALILFLQYLADFTQTYRILHWLMGGLDIVEYSIVLRAFFLTFPALLILAFQAKHFNLISAGDHAAISRGVHVERNRSITYFAASLGVAVVVSIAGPIGFVGLIIPHAMRLLVGSDHRILIPVSALSGGGFLILCDIISRTLFAPAELPIGVLTAMIGGPFFLAILLKSRNTSKYL